MLRDIYKERAELIARGQHSVYENITHGTKADHGLNGWDEPITDGSNSQYAYSYVEALEDGTAFTCDVYDMAGQSQARSVSIDTGGYRSGDIRNLVVSAGSVLAVRQHPFGVLPDGTPE